jgi:AbrB family looped-hinge helix DNA binding protein
MIFFVNKINLVILIEAGFDMETPESKKFYGSVTVSERGQIAIPVSARKDFGIKTGDKLLVFGDLERGIGIATFSIMQKTIEGASELFNEIKPELDDEKNKKPKTNNKNKDIK